MSQATRFMKAVIFLAAVLTISISFGQSPINVTPAPLQTLDIALTPFGIDNAIKVGFVDKSGSGFISTDIDFGLLAKSKPNDYKVSISELLSFCDKADELFGQEQKIDVLELSPYFLMNNNEVAGFISIVSDTAVANWVSEPEFGKSVLGAWYEPFYISDNYAYKGTCVYIINPDLGDEATVYDLDINLLKGLNFFEYKIESIYEGDDDELSSHPKKVTVTAEQAVPSNALWIAHYY